MQILVGVSAPQDMVVMPHIQALDAAPVVLHRTSLMLGIRSAPRVLLGQALRMKARMPRAQTLVLAD